MDESCWRRHAGAGHRRTRLRVLPPRAGHFAGRRSAGTAGVGSSAVRLAAPGSQESGVPELRSDPVKSTQFSIGASSGRLGYTRL